MEPEEKAAGFREACAVMDEAQRNFLAVLDAAGAGERIEASAEDIETARAFRRALQRVDQMLAFVIQAASGDPRDRLIRDTCGLADVPSMAGPFIGDQSHTAEYVLDSLLACVRNRPS